MAEFQELVETLTVIFSDRIQNKIEYTHGLLGDGEGRVRVSTTPNSPDVDYVYARPDRASDRVYKVFNKRVEGQDGDPIIIGSLPWEPDLIQVVDLDWKAYKSVGWGDDVTTTNRHGSSHQWRDAAPGIDTFNVYRRQMGDLKTYALASGTMNVGVSPYSLDINESQYQWPGTHGLDLTGAIPPGTGTAQMALVYWSPVSGTTVGFIGVATGTIGSSSDAVILNRPPTPVGTIPSALVKIRGGQSTITEFDIWDAREPFRPGETFGPGSYAWEDGITVTSDLYVDNADAASRNNITLSRSTDEPGRNANMAAIRSRVGETAVADGDTIGQFAFSGHDGTEYNTSAVMYAKVDGAVSTGTVPMSLNFDVSATRWPARETRLTLATGTVSIGDVAQSGDVDINLFSNSLIIQPTADSTTAVQILDTSDEVVLNVNTTNQGVGVGTDDTLIVVKGATRSVNLYLETTAQFAMVLARQGAGAGSSPVFYFARSRTGETANVDGDEAGEFFFAAHDGTDFNQAASISAEIDGTVSANTLPMALILKTSTTNSPTERMRISPAGLVGIGNVSSPLGKIHVDQSSTSGAIPVEYLDQADVDEPFSFYVGSAASANLVRSIVNEGDVTTATRQGWLMVEVEDKGNQITDQKYFVPIYTLA